MPNLNHFGSGTVPQTPMHTVRRIFPSFRSFRAANSGLMQLPLLLLRDQGCATSKRLSSWVWICCTVMTDSLPVGLPHGDLLSAEVGFKRGIILLAELGFRR